MLLSLPQINRIWVIGPIFGRATLLKRLHLTLFERLSNEDGLIYLGNYLGHGPEVTETLDEILNFRDRVSEDLRWNLDRIVFLRGAQEEMWVKLLQIQWAMKPQETFNWLMKNGAQATLKAYGGDPNEAAAKFRSGVIVTTRWTSQLRENFENYEGHYDFIHSLSSAALSFDKRLLFVAAGLDPTRSLDEQNDLFWWSSSIFESNPQAYFGFTKIIRGDDPNRNGPTLNEPVISLNDGFTGSLLAICLFSDGTLIDQIKYQNTC